MFKRRRFPVEIILVCVRWYCKYGISYRDLVEMMQERGVEVDPSTIMRWVHRYRPSWRSGYAGIKVIEPPPGAWTRRM
jgi:transposase, IS6 family